MTVYLVISLPKIPYINRIYMVLANPINMRLDQNTLCPLFEHTEAEACTNEGGFCKAREEFSRSRKHL
jgi:hypothetical protein